MAHVHGAKMVETAVKATEKVGSPMMMGGMMGPGMEGMKGMGGMMEHGAGMGSMMGSGMGMGMGMGTMMSPRDMTAGVATGAAVTASAATGHSLLRRVATHPLVLFGLGLAIGYLIHKYREDIIQQATEATE